MIKRATIAAAVYFSIVLGANIASAEQFFKSCEMLTPKGWASMNVLRENAERDGNFDGLTAYEAAGYFYDNREYNKINPCAVRIFEREI